MPPVLPPDAIANAVSNALRASGTKPASAYFRPAAPPPIQGAPPRALYELALTSIALGDDPAAIAALREAIARRPGFAAAWKTLAAALLRTGDAAAAAEAARKAARQAALAADPDPAQASPPIPPARLEAAERSWRDRLAGTPPDTAEMLLREALSRDPLDAAALHLLAERTLKAGQPHVAASMFARALELAPAYAAARHLYAVALFDQRRDVQAIAELRHLLSKSPTNPSYRILLGSCLAKTGDFAEAIRVYDSVLKDQPTHLGLWLSFAQALKAAGRREDSERAFRRCLALSPSCGDAHWGLQNLSTDAPCEAELQTLRCLLDDASLPALTRFQLHYTLAYALEKAGDAEASFAEYTAGAKIRRDMLGYRADEITTRVRRTKSLFTAAFLAARQGSGCPDPAPIFILGMPRAGSTLVEQILASHSAVEGTQELPEISHLADEIAAKYGGQTRFPECVAHCDATEFAELGARYLERCRAYRRTGKPMFIDKMPGNWVNAGLIHLMLPNARIIDARREPMANGFGAFKKYFSAGQDFSYNLTDIGRYYTDYRDLMAHFANVLPGRIHDVQYERLVDDTEAEIRRLLTYCGLLFEPGCLRFWASDRAVSTASAQQVRRPIYREGLDLWRRYEPWLDELRAALPGNA